MEPKNLKQKIEAEISQLTLNLYGAQPEYDRIHDAAQLSAYEKVLKLLEEEGGTSDCPVHQKRECPHMDSCYNPKRCTADGECMFKHDL
jgi:hypothetical protein